VVTSGCALLLTILQIIDTLSGQCLRSWPRHSSSYFCWLDFCPLVSLSWLQAFALHPGLCNYGAIGEWHLTCVMVLRCNNGTTLMVVTVNAGVAFLNSRDLAPSFVQYLESQSVWMSLHYPLNHASTLLYNIDVRVRFPISVSILQRTFCVSAMILALYVTLSLL